MNSCIICDSSENLSPNFVCQCVYCVDCLFQWFEEKINSDSNLQHIPCPNGDCKQKLRFDDINLQDKDQEAKFHQLAFKTYLCRTQDIRPCPNQTCNGFAFLPNERCGDDFSCEYCDFTWIDRNYLSISKLLSLKLREIKSEFLTTIIEFMMTSPCPKCETHIIKNGGCSHMTCKKCNFYFCWYCKHDLAHHTDSECSLRIVILIPLLIMGILNILFSANLFQYFIYPFQYLFLGIICNALFIEPFVSIYGIGKTILNLFSYFKTKNNNYKYEVRMSAILTICSSVALIPTYYLLYMLSINQVLIWNIFKWELLILSALVAIWGIIFSFHKFIYKEWLQYLI